MSLRFLFIVLVMIAGASAIAQPVAPSDLFANAMKLKEEKNYTAAVELLKKLLNKQPDHKEALFEAGWALNETGRYNEAVALLQKAAIRSPEIPKIQFELGYALFKMGRSAEAKSRFLKSLDLKEDYQLARKYLGHVLFEEKNYEQALNYYKQFLEEEETSTDPLVYFNRGYCEIELKKYADAILSLRLALKYDKDYFEAYNEIGFAQTQLNNVDEAIESYTRALTINQTSSVSYMGLGDVTKDLQKNTPEALRHYLNAATLDPTNARINYSIGWCYNDMKQFSSAIPYLIKAADTDKKYQAAITELGYSYYSTGNFAKAQEQFTKSLNISIRELPLYYSGLCYLKQGQKAKALKIFSDLEKMNSRYAAQLKTLISEA